MGLSSELTISNIQAEIEVCYPLPYVLVLVIHHPLSLFVAFFLPLMAEISRYAIGFEPYDEDDPMESENDMYIFSYDIIITIKVV